MSEQPFNQGRLPGVVLVKPRVFGDPRGFFTETYHARRYAEGGIGEAFVQDNFSFSRQYVLRGLHYQLRHPQGKLVYAIQGQIFDVAVDIRRGSTTFGQWEGHVLTGENHFQLYIPPGFAHGFVVLSETATVMYKCTDLYTPNDEFGIRWDDPVLNIDWPVTDPLLSEKDAILPTLAEAGDERLPTV